MKRLLLSLLGAALVAPGAYAAEAAPTVHKLSPTGIGDSLGVIVVTDTPQGLKLQPHLRKLDPGVYRFSVNETMACHSGHRGDGKMIAGLAAGDAIHELPPIEVGNDGVADQAVYAPRLSLKDISGRSLVLTEGGETGALGVMQGGGRRIACASLEQY